MLITGFPAGMFQTNCYLLAPQPGGQAVIIDPGQDAAPQVRALLAEHDLTPAAVLLTHGHLDHTWNATELCDEFAIPAYIHTADRPMLTDPGMGLGRALGQLIGDTEFTEPRQVVEFADGENVEIAGMRFTVDLAPGHTQGSVLLGIDVEVPADEDGHDSGQVTTTVPVCFSGDVLFAGSIGRTDLPGGDHDQLLESIEKKLLPLPDETQVLPGHGPQTSIGRERATNPFLLGIGTEKKGRFGL
ncbi:MBL fold metallo-hydrolase [Gordonia sp. (in: high G+C Gram-positive bacteria)]|jgi:glyoxylase-like metal-dependent hydrolase (beta-lactamase superfamily II)|uniref:MBL fold metallo-hydrolase n=1 Tax=Gordonia sp. (in: high G+C Gram-positive bacteria) TaxID=84139 RepID=UPI001DCC5113|nr:MBL fold metallo-hydrolase [Gordonia sp. (in: high G+C Gram-positive bacteria)]MCB1294503.1 MBL fold metallo-hydrolase [Gordonia sp. (in: high G+C Gram-positive bacteria)]HMS75482.1 MBL fold metallo-hydrolase [Gordonia sp. (in: high G+C Gram-positive bacteria)]HQV19100.1 MBL fold metallo-hydrolase [Gordonia sp. (in: high G+C Gram-positive bacteria)]